MVMIELNKAINALPAGAVLAFYSDNKVTLRDVPAWCLRTGNDLLSTDQQDGDICFTIRRGSADRNTHRPRDFSRYARDGAVE